MQPMESRRGTGVLNCLMKEESASELIQNMHEVYTHFKLDWRLRKKASHLPKYPLQKQTNKQTKTKKRKQRDKQKEREAGGVLWESGTHLVMQGC